MISTRAILVAVTLAATPALAQDVVGLEDCSKARGPDKKIGCMQSNVEFLHRLIKTGDTAAVAAQAKLNSANVKISELQAEIDRLKAALAQLEKKLPASPPAAPAAPATKP